MSIPVYNIIEHPALLDKTSKSDYLYNDTDTVFNLANLYLVAETRLHEISCINMASGKPVSLSKSELKSGNWQIQLIPEFVRRSIGM